MSFASRSMCRGTSPNFNWLVMCVGFKIICLFLLFLFLLTSFLMHFVAFFFCFSLQRRCFLSLVCESQNVGLRVSRRSNEIASPLLLSVYGRKTNIKRHWGYLNQRSHQGHLFLWIDGEKQKKIAITTQARIWDKDVKKIMKKSDFSSSPNQNT